MKQKTLVEGDPNLLEKNEILITKSEGYTLVRERDCTGKIKTSVLIPLDDLLTSKEE